MIFVFLAANKSYNKSISVFKKQLDSSLQNIIAKKMQSAESSEICIWLRRPHTGVQRSQPRWQPRLHEPPSFRSKWLSHLGQCTMQTADLNADMWCERATSSSSIQQTDKKDHTSAGGPTASLHLAVVVEYLGSTNPSAWVRWQVKSVC